MSKRETGLYRHRPDKYSCYKLTVEVETNASVVIFIVTVDRSAKIDYLEDVLVVTNFT